MMTSRDLKVKVATQITMHAVAQQCCKDDLQSQWERAKFGTPPTRNALTYRHQI